jgi:L-aminopeptidase/D-esterase-like protein
MIETAFPWMRVGHQTDSHARTGCTVVRFDEAVVASGEIRGSAPATREFGLLNPTRTVQSIDALVLSGGSAFGLAAADGVMASLAAADVGFETRFGRVPIVVGLSLFDLGVGDGAVRPGPEQGAVALEDASTTFEIGAVGAGTGATVGKWRGPDAARDAGIAWAQVRRDDLVVGALVAVNAVGDLTTEPQGQGTAAAIADGSFEWPEEDSPLGENTTIGLVVTNGRFSKAQCHLLAQAGHDGMARAIIPAHGPADGDALVAVGRPIDADAGLSDDVGTARLLAATAVQHAIAASRT